MLFKYMQVLLFLVFLLNYGCSSSDQTSNEETQTDEVYVFDEVPVDSTIIVEPVKSDPVVKQPSHYLVQIGAFTTREKAELFLKKSQEKISDEILIAYNHQVNLFVVQLANKFKTKNDAATKRNSLKIFDEFKDAWVVTVY